MDANKKTIRLSDLKIGMRIRFDTGGEYNRWNFTGTVCKIDLFNGEFFVENPMGTCGVKGNAQWVIGQAISNLNPVTILDIELKNFEETAKNGTQFFTRIKHVKI